MQEALQIAQFIISLIIIPALAWIIKLEHRLTRLEVKIEMLCDKLKNKGGEEK